MPETFEIVIPMFASDDKGLVCSHCCGFISLPEDGWYSGCNRGWQEDGGGSDWGRVTPDLTRCKGKIDRDVTIKCEVVE